MKASNIQTTETMALPPAAGKKQKCGAYFGFGIKSQWQQFALFLLLLLLACVLPTILSSHTIYENANVRRGENVWTQDAIQTALVNMTYAIGTVYVVVSGVLGIIAGMTACGYVNTKASVHFYHSMPLSRSMLFWTENGVRAIYYLAASLCSMTGVWGCIRLRFGEWGKTAIQKGAFTELVLLGVLTFFVVLSLFQLGGALTGTGSFRFVMSGILAFLPVLLYLVILGGVNIGMTTINTEKWMSDGVFRWLCPAVQIILSLLQVTSNSVYTATDVYLPLLVNTILYTGIAWLLHVKRRSELSGSSVIWQKVQTIVKYLVVFTCSAGFGILERYVVNGGGIWFIFACICGLLIPFLVMNMLIHRSVRAAFRGGIGLAITAAAVALYIVIFPYDLFHLNEKMYTAQQTDRLELLYMGETYSITDRKILDTVMPYIGEASGKEDYTGVDLISLQDRTDLTQEERDTMQEILQSTGFWHDDNMWALDSGRQSISISVYPKIGIPLHKYLRISAVSPVVSVYDMLRTSDMYIQRIRKNAENFLTVVQHEQTSRCSIEYDMITGYFAADKTNFNDAKKEFLVKVLKTYATFSSTDADTTYLGSMYVNTSAGRVQLPLYAGMRDLLSILWQYAQENDLWSREDYSVYMENEERYLPKYSMAPAPTQDVYAWLASQYECAVLVNSTTGRIMLVQETAQMEDLMAAGRSMAKTYLGAFDERYCIIFARKQMEQDIPYTEGVIETSDADIYPYSYWETDVFVFRDGKTPAWVVNALGE